MGWWWLDETLSWFWVALQSQTALLRPYSAPTWGAYLNCPLLQRERCTNIQMVRHHFIWCGSEQKNAVNITELCIVGSIQRHVNWFNRFALLSVHMPLFFLEPLMSSRKEILFIKIDFLPHWLAHSYSNRWIPATVSALLRFNLFTRADFRPRFSVIENNNLPRGFSKPNTYSEKSLCVNMLVMSLANTKLRDWKRSLK